MTAFFPAEDGLTNLLRDLLHGKLGGIGCSIAHGYLATVNPALPRAA